MNIRTVSNPILPVEAKRVNQARDVKTDTQSQERDADGRRQQDQEPDKNPLNEEEFKKAKDYLDGMPTGLKANGLHTGLKWRGISKFSPSAMKTGKSYVELSSGRCGRSSVTKIKKSVRFLTKQPNLNSGR